MHVVHFCLQENLLRFSLFLCENFLQIHLGSKKYNLLASLNQFGEQSIDRHTHTHTGLCRSLWISHWRFVKKGMQKVCTSLHVQEKLKVSLLPLVMFLHVLFKNNITFNLKFNLEQLVVCCFLYAIFLLQFWLSNLLWHLFGSKWKILYFV